MPNVQEIVSMVMNILSSWGIANAIGALFVVLISIAVLGAVTSWMQSR